MEPGLAQIWQVQKYEKGTNRIGAGRLLAMATALGVSIAFFFEGCAATESGEGVASDLQALLATRDGIALAQAFATIEDKTMRQALIAMAQAAARRS